VAAVLLIGLVVAACDSTATYPIDFFSEMHYQKSWHAQEPPRPDAPAGIVPITGGAVPNYTMDEAKAIPNPVPVNAQSQQLGQQLFAVNCQVCHGPNGDDRRSAILGHHQRLRCVHAAVRQPDHAGAALGARHPHPAASGELDRREGPVFTCSGYDRERCCA
jgi:mono/diheme cytochrome c family protein